MKAIPRLERGVGTPNQAPGTNWTLRETWMRHGHAIRPERMGQDEYRRGH